MGPISTASLTERLSRYLSPPLFPIRLRDLPSVTVHDLAPGVVEIGPFSVSADFIIHPARPSAIGSSRAEALAYLPDHEPAFGPGRVPSDPRWPSGHALAADADVLIHEAQLTDDEYPERIGWGHSSLTHALDFAELASVRRLVTFHHEPNHSDEQIDAHHADVLRRQSRKRPTGWVFADGLARGTFPIHFPG